MTDSTPATAAGRPCPRCFLTVGGDLHPATTCPELRPGSPAAIVAAEYDWLRQNRGYDSARTDGAT